MSMISESDIRQVFRATLSEVSDLPDYIAWENRSKNPPDPGSDTEPPIVWVKEDLRILDETHTAFGFITSIGEMLYSVYTPLGRGTREADDLSLSIANAFMATQSLSGNNIVLVLEHTQRNPYRADEDLPDWVFKTVTIRWRAHTATS